MDVQCTATFASCRDRLLLVAKYNVWSLIVTVLGDLAQAPGSQISSGVLSQITEPIGVKPEAMRVALHRLRKDGWIESHRRGRESFHALTERGRSRSAEASPRIYGPGVPTDAALHILIVDGEDVSGRQRLESLVRLGTHVPLGPLVAFGLGEPPTDLHGLGVFKITDEIVPVWLKTRVCPPELLNAYRSLLSALETVSRDLEREPHLPTTEVVALRALIVHNWRRILLRHPDLPIQFFPDDWPGLTCRALVSEILSRLPRPTDGQESLVKIG